MTTPSAIAPPVLATQVIQHSRAIDNWRRRALIGAVALYAGVLVIAPLLGLINGALSKGFGAVLDALRQPAAINAFSLTLQIAFIAVVVHAVFGTTLAWVLTRHKFWGRRIVNSLIDLPFAVSAVVVGYMLLLIFGSPACLARPSTISA